MKNLACILVVLVALSLVTGCGRSGATIATPRPTRTPQPTDTSAPPAPPTTACPSANAEGTIPPAVAIYSITFIVNGREQVVRDGDTLQASRGDEVQVREVTVCANPFSGNGGEACVEFTPLDQNGQEMVAEGNGTHIKQVVSGFTSIPGPNHTWTVGENWRHIVAELNHWPPGGTNDPSCGDGRCEHDDRMIVDFQ